MLFVEKNLNMEMHIEEVEESVPETTQNDNA